MRFLVDAQLPWHLAKALSAEGHDAVHTYSLPAKNQTPDADLHRLADQDGRILITKDSDFVASHLLEGKPALLLLVSTGNISNEELWSLFRANLEAIEKEFKSGVFVEINRTELILHG